MDSIGVQSVLRLLPEETRHQLTSLPLSSLLNTAEGSHIFKRVVNAILPGKDYVFDDSAIEADEKAIEIDN